MKTFIIPTVPLLMLLLRNLALISCNSTLGVNLVTNGGFQNPIIPLLSSQHSYPLTIPSWNCKSDCKVIASTLYSLLYLSLFPNIAGQVLDLDSSSNEVVNQTLNLPSLGQYQFSFQWIPPVQNATDRFAQVYVNQVMIVNITINASNSVAFHPFNFTKSVNLTSSQAILSFRMGGTANNHGIMIDNVACQQVIVQQNTIANQTMNTTNAIIINSTALINNSNSTSNPSSNTSNSLYNNTTNQNNSQELAHNNQTMPTQEPIHSDQQYYWAFEMLNLIISNNFSSTLNSVPGGRVFFSTLLNSLTNFDRLQFYYFHHQKLTSNSQKFLSIINDVQNSKGSIISTLLQTYQNSSSLNFISDILNWHADVTLTLNYKVNYSDPWVSAKTGQGSHFLPNNFDFFFYAIIGTFLCHLILNLLFKMLFNYRISTQLRKYCFSAMIFLELLQGNIQQFTFYYFQQMKSLFVFTFAHKLQSVVVIYFYFLILFFSVGGILLLRNWYKRYIKYFIQEYKKQLISFAFLAFQFGITPIAFGMAHSLLQNNLAIQTLVLACLQLVLSSITIAFLIKNIFEVRLTIYIKLLISYLRIFFIFTFYLYNQYPDEELLNTIHYALIMVFVVSWILQISAQILYSIRQLCRILKRIISLHRKKPPKPQKKKTLNNAKTIKVISQQIQRNYKQSHVPVHTIPKANQAGENWLGLLTIKKYSAFLKAKTKVKKTLRFQVKNKGLVCIQK